MKRLTRILLTSSCLGGLALVAAAQGTDSCTAPTAIAGAGSFAFNNTSATTGTQGQANTACDFFSSTAITNDVWFVWTAPTTDTYEMSTCGTTGVDTKLAAYAGTACPGGAPLACADDSCSSFQTTISFAATAGSTYVLQLGTYPFGAAGGTGTFSMSVYVPPPPCSVHTGPDVIVGDLQDIANYNTTGGLDAISLGTTSCNIGTVNLSWIANTNQHPAIGGNLYRYRVVSGSGRFEQIGMSWLKHGFFALSNELCCVNCQATDGSTLGVNCADPYTAGRNGGQGGLGPRWQVNAHTGVFTYPPANPSWSGNTARRCEFLLADVDTTPGVRYFGEAQYVTPDDAAAGNQNNNASYRELSVTGTTNFDFQFVTATQREKAAIEAWKVVDPAVTINDVQVSGDGLFKVAYKTTNLGGGQYHYEYAVYNMNSDRCGGSFSIPLPAGVVVSNVGFHDVDYRNGDGNGNVNFSGTDWTVTQTATSITWACQTQAANTNANALRWGTTYNFRFDANAAPSTGNATLGLWKTGSPGNVVTSVNVPAGSTNFAYCFGDGTGTACPCANNSVVGNNAGCLNSLASAGKLVVSGVASLSGDTVSLAGTGMPSGSALYFQGTTQLAGGLGNAFGDGLRCVGGTTVRLAIKTNSGAGSSSFPVGADPLVSVKGGVAAGDVRYYSIWYRDSASFCTANTYNLTNGWALSWAP